MERVKFRKLGLLATPDQTLEYLGNVTHGTNEKIYRAVKRLINNDPEQEIFMIVTSAGGPTGLGMSFYDTMRYVLKPRLTTIGTGDVDSSGLIIFLAGFKRYISKNTTLLLHPAGRRFDPSTRYTTREMEAMLNEDRLKDLQYASVVADNSLDLTPIEVLQMMERHTILTPEDLIRHGLAHELLS